MSWADYYIEKDKLNKKQIQSLPQQDMAASFAAYEGPPEGLPAYKPTLGERVKNFFEPLKITQSDIDQAAAARTANVSRGTDLRNLTDTAAAYEVDTRPLSERLLSAYQNFANARDKAMTFGLGGSGGLLERGVQAGLTKLGITPNKLPEAPIPFLVRSGLRPGPVKWWAA
jgi:hypothetical protein